MMREPERIAMERALDALGEHDAAAMPPGLPGRVAAATFPALSGGPALRLAGTRADAGRRLMRWGGLAAAACLALAAAVAFLPGPKPASAPGLAESEVEDDVAVLLAAMDLWEGDLSTDLDVAMAEAAGLERDLDAWAGDWPAEGAL